MSEKKRFLKRFNGFSSKFQILLLGTARGGEAARIRKLSKHPVAGVTLPTERGKNRILMRSQVRNGHLESHFH